MRAIRFSTVVNSTSNMLFEHEFEALLEAVRRDLRNELRAVREDRERSLEHANNARRDRRILDVLRPKNSQPILQQMRAPLLSTGEADAKIAFNLNIDFLQEQRQ